MIAISVSSGVGSPSKSIISSSADQVKPQLLKASKEKKRKVQLSWKSLSPTQQTSADGLTGIN